MLVNLDRPDYGFLIFLQNYELFEEIQPWRVKKHKAFVGNRLSVVGYAEFAITEQKPGTQIWIRFSS